MKKIVLQIEDEIFADLESALITRGMVGHLFGTIDEFMVLLVKAIKAGKKDVTIIKKKRKKRKKKKQGK